MTEGSRKRAGYVVRRAADEAAMVALGAALGRALKETLEDAGAARALVVYLRGALGAGKTTFARGVLRAFGVAGAVKSPTYTLLEPYETPCGQVVHIDLYRLAHVEEAEYLGLREYLDRGVCLFEWPERAAGALPPADVTVSIAVAGTAREVTVTLSGPGIGAAPGARILRELLQESFSNT